MVGSIFDTLLEDIRRHPDRADAQRIDLERRLRQAVFDGLQPYLPTWKRNREITPISVICALPASNQIIETSEEYERLVYGAAARILTEEGFVFGEGEERWYYRPASKP